MCILTAVRTSLGPVYLVPHGTVIPPGDGSQSTRCEPPPGVLPQWRWKHRPAASATTTFIPYYLDKRDWHEDTYGCLYIAGTLSLPFLPTSHVVNIIILMACAQMDKMVFDIAEV